MSNNRQIMLDGRYEYLSNEKDKLLLEIDKRVNKNKNETSDKLTDIADIASNSLQNELSMMVASEEIKKLKQIEEALSKIDLGNYGICTSCNCEINMERLKALPFVTLCVKCKELEESEEFPEDVGFSYGRDNNLYDLFNNENESFEKDLDSKENDTNKDFSKNENN